MARLEATVTSYIAQFLMKSPLRIVIAVALMTAFFWLLSPFEMSGHEMSDHRHRGSSAR